MLSDEECFSDNSTGKWSSSELSENRDQCSEQVMLHKFAGQDKREKGDTQTVDLKRGAHLQDLADREWVLWQMKMSGDTRVAQF